MYKMPNFKDREADSVSAFMQSRPFALVIGTDMDGLAVATQIPLLLLERAGVCYLQGHVMRNTDHCRAFESNSNVLVVFTGPSAYVSATWYTEPQGGSTWNYMTVHARGTLRFMEDHETLDFMQRLSLHFEDGNTASSTVFANLPPRYIDSLMPAIAGFEIRLESIDHTFKLSQNRDEVSYKNIISQLESRGGQAAEVAEEMKRRQYLIFPPEGD
jgi:transcriptional regulator